MARIMNNRKGKAYNSPILTDPVSWAREEVKTCLTRAEKSRLGHRYEEAMTQYEQALGCLPPPDLSVVKRAQIERSMIECLCDKGEYTSALEELDKTRKQLLPDADTLTLELGRLHALSAFIHSQLGSYDEARDECRKALEVFEVRGNEEEASKVYKHLGQIQLLTGDVSGAYSSFVQSLDTCRKLDKQREMASVMNRMAHLYFISADWERCISLLQEARKIAEKHEMLRLVGAISANLGTIHFMMGNWELSKQCNESSLSIFRVLGDSLSIARRYILLGNLHQVKREWPQARSLYEKAKTLSETQRYQRELALSIEFLGELAFDMDRIAEAEKLYKSSLRIARSIAPAGDLINEIYRRLAEVKVYRGEAKKALALCQKAWDISLRLGDRYEEGIVFRVFGSAYDLQGDAERARDYFILGIDALRSIGEKYERAKTLRTAGTFIAREFDDYGSKMEALRYLSQSRDIFKELGLDHNLALVELELEHVRQTTLT